MEFNRKKLTKLSDITTIIGDGLHGTPRYSKDGSYYFINGRNLNEAIVIDDKTKKVNDEEYEKYKKDLNNRTIFLSINGTIGNTAYYNDENVVLGKSVCYINVIDEVNKNYIYYLLKSRKFKEYYNRYSTGTTIKNLGLKEIRNFEFILPREDVQSMVANILLSYDKKIETNNKIIANLETQAQALFKYYFVDFEPFRDDKFIDSDLGPIPEGWEVTKLDRVINIYDSKRIPLSKMQREQMEKIYPYYGANGIIDYVDDYIFEGTYLLMGEDGTVVDEFNHPILNYVSGKIWVNNHAHVITGKNLSTEFIYILLSQTNIQNIITGAVQLKINQTNLKSIKVISPPDNILNEYEQIINSFFRKILTLKKQNQILAGTRDTLLPKLMAGEIDLEDIGGTYD